MSKTTIKAWTYKGMRFDIKYGKFDETSDKEQYGIFNTYGDAVNVTTKELRNAVEEDYSFLKEDYSFRAYWGYSDDLDETIIHHRGGGVFSGDGDDIITGYAGNNGFEMHLYAGAGDDWINMNFKITARTTKVTSGHHVEGDNRKNFVGSDVFNFQDIESVGDKVGVGRIEDFDPTRDEIRIAGDVLDLDNLPSNVRIVSYNGGHDDHYDENGREVGGVVPQRWILIENSQGGLLFYALDGARVNMFDSNGPEGDRKDEDHFLRDNYWQYTLGKNYTLQQLKAHIKSQKDVKFKNDFNLVPDGYQSSGQTYNDVDRSRAQVTKIIQSDKKNDFSGDDLIAAGLNDDVVKAGTGNDRVWGGSGYDKIFGQSGNDVLSGNSGNDRLFGGKGHDRLHGGAGNDYLRDDVGADKFYGGTGNDTVSYYGWLSDVANPSRTLTVNLETGKNNSADTYRSIENLQGSKHHGDHLTGSKGANKIWGAGGDDKLYGLSGDDKLYGQDGKDRLFGGKGHDRLYGGDGNDYLRDDKGHDKFYGGDGNDTVSYYGWLSHVANPSRTLTVNLETGKNNSGDTYSSIENLMGSKHHGDHLTGSNGANKIWGAGGNDKMFGLSGNDKLDGGSGNDRLYGGAGDDVFFFSDRDGRDVIADLQTGMGSSGHDVIHIRSDSYGSYAGIQTVMSQSGSSVVINYGDRDTITLLNTQLSELNADMFDFV